MARGKVISVYLIDGEANGKIKASISNWNGIAYKIPRRLLAECKGLDAFKQSGVYFLFGNNTVYVGQAEVRKNGKGIHQRILDHENDKYKDCWDEVVIFTRKDNSLGRTDISYLENRFYNKALDAGRFQVQNSNEPTIGTVTEEKESELEEYIDQAELVLGALGYKVFELKEAQDYPLEAKDMCKEKQTDTEIPDLPDSSLKIGKYVRTAMRCLSECGYEFDFDTIQQMCTSEWSREHFHTDKAFMKQYIEGKSDNKGTEGKYIRFWSEIFTFGKYSVYISKEWFESQRKYFDSWYLALKEKQI